MARSVLLLAALAAARAASAQTPPPPDPLSTAIEVRIDACLDAALATDGSRDVMQGRMAACIEEVRVGCGPNGSGLGADYPYDCWNAEWAAWWRIRARAHDDLAALLPDPDGPGGGQAHEAARALAEADAAWAEARYGDCGFLSLRWLGTLGIEEGFTCAADAEARRAITYRLWRHEAERRDGFVGGD